MATLVSPGVTVPVTDESFFIPAAAPTVPLIFITTGEEKLQADGTSPAAGTYEHDVVRTVTSLTQSQQLYGIPVFLEDASGNQLHADARNEYGLDALNRFLGVANRAYVIRAHVDVNDDRTHQLALWASRINSAALQLETACQKLIDDYNTANALTPGDVGYKLTVNQTQLNTEIATALTNAVFTAYAFRVTAFQNAFKNDQTLAPFNVYSNGYSQPPVAPAFLGIAGIIAAWVSGNQGGTVATEFTPAEAAQLLTDAAADFQYTTQFRDNAALGANDAARRTAIVTALAAAINSNTMIRSEQFDYNLVLAPGFPEVVDELLALVTDIQEEAFVIGETPFTSDPDGLVTTWADNVSSDRRHSAHVAYYYPHGLASNQFTGKDNFVAASGIALRTYAYSDNNSELWRAPAGTQRGIVTGVSKVGYVSGTLGSATTFNEVALSLGQRDNLYKYFTNINPIANLPGRGILVFGQKTSAPDASAMDRVNVSRLIKYIKRQLRRNTVPFLFEPNDQITRNNIKAVIEGFLGDIVVRRGLYDYAVVCDDTNNTPDRIDRNELWVDVALKPTKAVEFIYIPLRIVATGAQI